MAKHRLPKKQRARRTALASLAALGLSGALVLGQATNTTALLTLTSTVVGIGGLYDTTGANVPAKLDHTVVPGGYAYHPIDYPANANLSASRDTAVPVLNTYLFSDAAKAEPILIVAGYSEGTLAAEQEKRNLQNLSEDAAPSTNQLSFVMIGSPFAANGGIYGRFPGISIPFVTDAMGAAQPSRYDTTYDTLEYDTYGDFPAYFNPLALLNTALGIRYAHPDGAYDPIDPATAPQYVTTTDNPGGGHDTYVLYYNSQLPLLGPLRELSSMTGTTAFTEPFISAVEPLLRVMVDMAYTDRVNADPTAAVPFSLITPPQKFIEALAAIPGALAQGVTNLLSLGHATVTPPNPIGNLQEGAAVTPQVQSSPARLALVATPAQDAAAEKHSTATTPDPTPAATPTVDTAPSSTADPAPKPDPATSSPEPTSTPVANDLHPTVTSDGNKFTPGTDGTPARSTPSGGTATDPVETTPTSTTTTATTPAPTDTKPADTKPADTKPDTTPTDTKPTGGTASGAGSQGAAAA